MARKWVKYDTTKFKEEIPELSSSNVEIYFDVENGKNYKEILDILEHAGSKKLKRIIAVILSKLYLENIYKREDKNITAIKIKSGIVRNQEYRIYCKEIFQDGKKVVMVSPYLKKVNRNQDDKRIVEIIEKIKSYSYEF